MPVPLSTGAVARELGCTEPRLNDLIRRGKIEPVPPIVDGRRSWDPEHLRAAAAALGVDAGADAANPHDSVAR